MNITYQIHQAERHMSYTERREADVAIGELASAFATIGRSVRAALARRAGHSRPNLAFAPAEDFVFIPGDNLIPVQGDELVSAG